jgi:hypothetical protein
MFSSFRETYFLIYLHISTEVNNKYHCRFLNTKELYILLAECRDFAFVLRGLVPLPTVPLCYLLELLEE